MLFYLLLFFLSYQLPLFYDNILFSSKIPGHFFQNGFLSFPLPVKIDTGYGPLWGWYIALGWQLLGKSLWVNHLLCLPILIVAAWFYLKVVAYFLPSSYLWLSMLLLFLEPTYLAQSTNATPDLLVLMAFMGGLYSIIYNKKYLLIFLSVLLAMLNARGALLVFVLFINQLVFYYYKHKKIEIKLILPYLIPAGFFVFWAIIHCQQTGYLFVRADSPWVHHHQFAKPLQILNNLKFIVWTFFDFGRLFLLIPTFLLLMFLIWKRKSPSTKTKILLHWCFWAIACLTLILCLRTNPILHRYFIVCYLLLFVLCIKLASNHLKKKLLYGMLIMASVGLVSGHFWIYPDKLSQGWDASLSHLPYFKLRTLMMDYLKEENIELTEVITGFPMFNSTYYTNFTNNKTKFITIHKKKLTETNYVVYTNVCNDFSDAELDLLYSEQFVLEKSFKKSGVKMQLFRRL